jgi:molybdopterin synthase sulfur carrier subunit
VVDRLVIGQQVGGRPVSDRIGVTVRFFAAAKAAAGVNEEVLTVERPATVADVLRAAVDAHGPKLADVLRRCSYLLTETAVHNDRMPVSDGAVLDILPPFAGG